MDTNISKIKRNELVNKIDGIRNYLKKQNFADASIYLDSLDEIEYTLFEKKFGLIWEQHFEKIEEKLCSCLPYFDEDYDRKIFISDKVPTNFILEGDNLISLSLLKLTRRNSIDVIYIDPPYNTGNSFIYNDSIIGNDDEYKHSKWLSFMEKRLRIARELLKDDGVCFISINDFEGAHLKLLCDEIFGEANFVGQLTWESTTQPANAGKAKFSLQKKVESIYCYCSNKNKLNNFILKEVALNLKYPHKGKFGKCRFEIIEKSDSGTYQRDTMKFKILGKSPRKGKRWQIGEKVARELEKQGKLEIVDGVVKKAVYPSDETNKKKFSPFWSHLTAKEVGTAQTGKDELKNILGFDSGFDTVKPVKLIKELLSHLESDICILDFFAGTGTTGQAVLELNEEDGGTRNFIVCTDNESDICRKLTYPRINTVISGKRADGTKYCDSKKANLKYFKGKLLDISKLTYFEYEDELLKHINELIELDHGLDLEHTDKVRVLTSDDEVHSLINEISNNNELCTIYRTIDVDFDTNLFDILEANDVMVADIPQYYYADERE